MSLMQYKEFAGVVVNLPLLVGKGILSKYEREGNFMITRVSLSIITFAYSLLLSANDYKETFITKPPVSFNVVIKEKRWSGEVTFNMKENTLSIAYDKTYTIRGEEIKSKTISANLKDEDKVLIYESVLRSNMFSIKDKKLNALGTIKRYPHSNTYFKIELNENKINNHFECDVENLGIFNAASPRDDINKLWALYEVTNLLLQLRCNETIHFDNWLLIYLIERFKAGENGEDKFDNDLLPNGMISSHFKILKKYTDLLNKQKEQSLTKEESNTMAEFETILNSPDLSKIADLPYSGFFLWQLKKEPDELNEDIKVIRKRLEKSDLKNDDELKQTLMMFEEFLEKYSEQNDNPLYIGIKDFYELLKNKEELPNNGLNLP